MEAIKEFISLCKELGIEFSIPVVLVIFVCTAVAFKNLEGKKSYIANHRGYVPFIIGFAVQILFDASYKMVAVASIWNGLVATAVAILIHAPLEAGFKKIGIKF